MNSDGSVPIAPPEPKSNESRYRFTGSGLTLLGLWLAGELLNVLTCGIFGLLGIPFHWRSRWLAENLERDGKPFVYQASWVDSLGFQLAAGLLVAVTCGLAFPFVTVANLRFRARHMTTAEGHRCEFDGGYFEGAALLVGGAIITVATCGLAFPVAVVWWIRYSQEGFFVHDPAAADGRCRLRFYGGALSFLVEGLVSVLLCWLTVGWYIPWAIASLERWLWTATGDELSPRLDVSVGPRSSGEWIRVAIAGLPIVLFGTATIVVTVVTGTAVSRSRSSDSTGPAASVTSSVGAAHVPRQAEPRRLWPTHVSASSYLRRGGNYAPHQMFDGDLRTCWADGVRGHGVGEWIEADLGATRIVRRVVLVPGYDKWHPRSGDLFFLNTQLRGFRLESDSGWSRSFTAPHGVRRVSYDIDRIPTRRLRLWVQDVSAGTRWADLSVSEMELYGD